jgi:two-component SAPR family response regulator
MTREKTMETVSLDSAGSAIAPDYVSYYSDSNAWQPAHDRAPKHNVKNSQTREIPYVGLAVRIFTFGRFSILLNNQTADFSSNGQKKSLELLKTLIAFGGREVGEVRLCEALWPDSDGDVAHTTFSVTLHRLRKLIGSDALLLCDSRLTLNADVCWVDAWEYERTLGQIKQLLHTRPIDPQHITKLVHKAIDLYHGPYLGSEDEQPWFLSYRERLHNKFIRCLLDVCAYMEKNQRYDEASRLYESGLDIDDLCESIYVKLMACYRNLGRRAQAMKVYQRCQSVIKAHYGVEPSSELQTLFESLKKCA